MSLVFSYVTSFVIVEACVRPTTIISGRATNTDKYEKRCSRAGCLGNAERQQEHERLRALFAFGRLQVLCFVVQSDRQILSRR